MRAFDRWHTPTCLGSCIDCLGVTRFVHDVLVAVALVLVIEGIWPFLSPEGFRRVLLLMAAEEKRSLRLAGLASMLSGVGLLYLVN